MELDSMMQLRAVTMTTRVTLENLDKICSEARFTREEHYKLMQAIKVLKAILLVDRTTSGPMEFKKAD